MQQQWLLLIIASVDTSSLPSLLCFGSSRDMRAPPPLLYRDFIIQQGRHPSAASLGGRLAPDAGLLLVGHNGDGVVKEDPAGPAHLLHSRAPLAAGPVQRRDVLAASGRRLINREQRGTGGYSAVVIVIIIIAVIISPSSPSQEESRSRRA